MKEKRWYTFIADGKRVGTIEDSAKCRSEIKRLRNLAGISIVEATGDDLIKINAKTALSKRDVVKMENAYLARKRKKENPGHISKVARPSGERSGERDD